MNLLEAPPSLMLDQTRCRDGKKTPVEFRKTAKRYLDFIKASQRFYREYIQKLASTFGGIPQLDAIAHSLKVDGTESYGNLFGTGLC